MVRENSPSARDIFLKAIEFERDSERDRYVERACSDDADLRHRVMELLAADQDPVSLLDRPAAKLEFLATVGHESSANGIPTTAAHESPGATIGSYRLLQEIGQGGFGIVFMAEQQAPVRRTVALKIIKPGMDTREVIARFEAERQALALMDHPNIASVLDAGTTSAGRPYFVMELVKGVPITEFCDKNSLSTQERLELFITVCRAIQHAHQKGVIHRDLKPSNVMITLHDGIPVPKVIDFGISKAIAQKLTEKTLFTRYGQMVGTPQYMSPEQAEMSGLDVDTRSDVYSLGVLLYELLTGTTPLNKEQLREAGYAEMLRLIQESEAPKPSTRLTTLNERMSVVCQNRNTSAQQLGQLLRGDLDWIVMRALDKDRARRYDSANALADDIRRHLKDEPVSAGAPSSAYLLQKLVRRNRGLVATLAAVAGSLVFGLALATAGFIQANQERQLALAHAKKAQDAQHGAEDAKVRAEEARDSALRNELAARQSRAQAEQAQALLERKLYDDAILRAAESLKTDAARTHEAIESCPPHLRHWEWARLKAQLPDVRRYLELDEEISSATLDPRSIDPEDPVVLSVDKTGLVTLRHLATDRTVWAKRTSIPSPALVKFSHDGELIALVTHFAVGISSGDCGLEIWDRRGVKLWESDDSEASYYVPSFSRDGNYCAISKFNVHGPAGSLELRRTRDYSLVWKKDAPGMNLACFSRDSRRVLFCQARSMDTSTPAAVKCLNSETGEMAWELMHTATSRPVPHPNGKHVVLGGQNHDLAFHDLESGALVESIAGFMPDDASLVEFSPDGKRAFSMGSFGHVAFWDIAKRRITSSFKKDQRFAHIPNFNSDSSGYLLHSDDRKAMIVSDFEGGELDLTMRGHTSAVVGLALNQESLLSMDRSGIVRQWNPDIGLETSATKPFARVAAVGFDIPNNVVAVADRKTVSILQNGIPRTLATDVSNGALRKIEFGANGRRMAIGYSRGLVLWDTSDWSEHSRTSFDRFVDGFCFVGDDELAVVLSGSRVVLLNPRTETQKTLRPGDPTSSASIVLWLPESQRLALGVDQRVEIWDLPSRSLVSTLNNDVALVTCLAATADEKRLFVGNSAGQISVLSLDSHRRIHSWRAHGPGTDDLRQGVTDLLLSNDDATLYSAGTDGRIKAWESRRPTEQLLERRSLVWKARSALDRFASIYGTQDLIERLREEPSIAPEVLTYALRIANARGDLLYEKMDHETTSDPLTAVNLSPDWPNSLRAQKRFFLSAADDLGDAIEASIGSPLDAIDYATFDAATWLAQANELAKLPIGETQLAELVTELLARYPDSNLLHHLLASAHAARGRWRDAGRELRTAIENSPQYSDIHVALVCQLGAVKIQLGEVKESHQIRDELTEALDQPLSPRIALRLARFLLAVDLQPAVLVSLTSLLESLPRETLVPQEAPWLHIMQGQLAAHAGFNDKALESFQAAHDSITSGPYGNYARVAAFRFRAVVAKNMNQPELERQSYGVIGFVESVQPFTRPNTQGKHRLWEDWVYCVHAGRKLQNAK